MNILEMILSNIHPLRMGSDRYYFRKCVFSIGYQVLQKSDGDFIHIKYIGKL